MFRTILLGHPLIVAMQTLRDELRVISRVLGGAAGTSSSAGGASGSAPSAPTPGTSPPPPSPTPATTTTPSLARRIIGVPQLPDVAALEAALGGRPAGSYDPAAFARAAAGLDLESLAPSLFLSDAAQRNIARLRQPVDLFAAERRRLVDAEGRTPAEQLAARRAEELPLRQALTDIVQRLFPPAVARYVPQLHALFERLDREIYGVQPPPSQAGAASPPAAAQTPELPVLQVPESNRLRPVVRQLHIQARSDDEPAVRAWTEQLRQALVAQSYAVEV